MKWIRKRLHETGNEKILTTFTRKSILAKPAWFQSEQRIK